MLQLMTMEDIDTIFDLEKQIFEEAWSKDNFIYEVSKNPFSKIFIWKEEEQIIGYIGVWLLFDQAQITNLAIVDKYRRQGYAKKMLEYIFDLAKSNGCENMTLEVRVSNQQSIQLYKSMGFQILSTKKDYYKDHEDAYLMMKGLI